MDMKVLIVEDDFNFIETLKLEFSDRDIEVLSTNSIDEVRSLTDDNITHAIVDLRIKDLSGLEVIPLLREKFENIRIVMLTGFGSISTTVEAIKLGADDYLTKPIRFDVLLASLNGNKDEVTEAISSEHQSLNRNEREYIEFVLRQCEGNISKAAKALGIHRQSLQRKLRKYTPNS